MVFLIKYASRGRRELFLKRMVNIKNSISEGRKYKIIVSIDEDDMSMNDLPHFPNTLFCIGKSKNKIEAINANMDVFTQWDVLINFSDDMVFTAKNWDLMMEHLIKESWPDTDFFAHFNDGYVGDKLPTMSIMGKKYYERDNYIYHPSYKTESSDAEAMYVSMIRGKYKYFSDILFKHEHPCNTGGKSDDTYERNGVFARDDHKNYFHRMKNYFFTTPKERVSIPEKLEREISQLP